MENGNSLQANYKMKEFFLCGSLLAIHSTPDRSLIWVCFVPSLTPVWSWRKALLSWSLSHTFSPHTAALSSLFLLLLPPEVEKVKTLSGKLKLRSNTFF
jgi:hypothetical protein